MKKLLIALFLLLTVAAFAIESAPSAVVGYVKYDCITTATSNFNFISLPMNSGFALASDIGNAFPNIDAINKWDAASQTWVAANFVEEGVWDGDFDVSAGMPLMINATANFSFYSLGTVADQPTYDLVTTETSNLNFIMVPLSASDLTMAGTLGENITNVNAVNKWDASSQAWVAANFVEEGVWDGDFDVSVGMPLMVNVDAPVLWPSVAKSIKVKTNKTASTK